MSFSGFQVLLLVAKKKEESKRILSTELCSSGEIISSPRLRQMVAAQVLQPLPCCSGKKNSGVQTPKVPVY